MKKYIYLTFAVVLVLFSNSCQRNLATYSYEDGCAAATFAASTQSFSMVAEDGNKIVVELKRGNTKGNASVSFEMEDFTEGVFVPEKNTFDFKDGENTASVAFNYPDLQAFLGEVYTFNLTIDPEQASLTGKSTVAVKAQRKLTKVAIGEATVTSGWWQGETYTADAYSTEEASNLYYIEDCFDKDYEFTFTDNGDGTVTVPDQAVYCYTGYGDVLIINASGTISGKTVTITGEWYLEAIGYSFGPITDTIVLP